MTRWHHLHRKLRRTPAPVAVAVGFVLLVASAFLLASLLPPMRDPDAECRKQCEPRHGRLVDDKNYPPSKGRYRQICVCT